MKKNIAIIVLVIVIGVLLFFLLRGGKEYDSHTSDYDMVKTDNKILNDRERKNLHIIDSLERDIKRRDTAETKLKADLAIYRKDLDKSTTKAVALAKEIKEAKKDTTVYDRKCDSLANEALNYAYLYEQYKASSDSLSKVVDSNKVDFELAMQELKQQNKELKATYDQLYRLYDNLFKDYSSARKTIKREKLRTKIAALLGLAAGGALLLK